VVIEQGFLIWRVLETAYRGSVPVNNCGSLLVPAISRDGETISTKGFPKLESR
jgi:hypothetical protein